MTAAAIAVVLSLNEFSMRRKFILIFFFSHHIPLAFLHLLCSFLPRLLPPPLARHNKNNNNNPGYAAKGWLTHIYVSSLEAIIAVA